MGHEDKPADGQLPDGRFVRWFEDHAHTDVEERSWVIGPPSQGRLLLVVASEGAAFTDGTVGLVSAGPRLEMWARWNNGEPNPYGDLWTTPSRRVAEGAA